MTLPLSDEQRQALAAHPSEPVLVEDPQTHIQYVLLRLEDYQRLNDLVDDGTPDPRAFYSAFAQAVKDDVDAPGMEEYDNYDLHRKKP
jgi:hypothetical protein